MSHQQISENPRPDPPFEEQPMQKETGFAKENTDPWIHRSTTMTCRTCMFYLPKVKDQAYMYAEGVPPQPLKVEGPTIGRCRRHAPTMSGYPVVYPVDWCGDHKLDETKI